MKNEIFIKIFDSNYFELLEILPSLEKNSFEALYTEVLMAYLQGNKSKLEVVINKLEKVKKFSEHPFFLNLCKLRLEIRESRTNEKLIKDMLPYLEEETIWQGELAFVIAFSYAKGHLYPKAKIYFKLAHQELKKAGVKRKSLLAFQNYVAVEYLLYPEKIQLAEHKFLAKESHKLGFNNLEALAYLNLSYLYFKINALNVSLKECLKAEKLMIEDTGLSQYWLIKSHKAYLYIKLGRIIEAKESIEELRLSKHKSIEETTKLLGTLVDGNHLKDIDFDALCKVWQSRFVEEKEFVKRPKLGKLEQELIRFIAEGPCDKFEIIENLYGNSVDIYSLENRFKRLIGRTRKKVPGLIIFEDGKYRLSSQDEIFQILGKEAS